MPLRLSPRALRPPPGLNSRRDRPADDRRLRDRGAHHRAAREHNTPRAARPGSQNPERPFRGSAAGGGLPDQRLMALAQRGVPAAAAGTRLPGRSTRTGQPPLSWPHYPRFRTPGRSRPLTDSTSPARAGRDYWTVADIHPHYRGPPAVQRHPAASLSVKEGHKQLTHPIRRSGARCRLPRSQTTTCRSGCSASGQLSQPTRPRAKMSKPRCHAVPLDRQRS